MLKFIFIFETIFFGICYSLSASLGGQGAQFLKLKVSARLESLAGTGTAQSANLSNLPINPAALSQLKSKELFFTQGFLFENVKFSYLSYCHPTKWGNAGLDYFYLNYGEFDSTNENREKIGTQSPKDFYAGFGWSVNGKNFSLEELDLGFLLKTIHSDLGNKSANAFSLSLGGIYKTVFENLSLGFAINHLGQSLKYDKETLALPRTMRFGLGFSGKEFSSFSAKLNSFLDGVMDNDGSAYSLLGSELILLNVLSFQIGYAGEERFQNRFRYGFGIGIQNFELNYSGSFLGGLETKHLVSLNMRFSQGNWGLKTLFSKEVKKNVLNQTRKDQDNPKIITEKPKEPDSSSQNIKSELTLEQENIKSYWLEKVLVSLKEDFSKLYRQQVPKDRRIVSLLELAKEAIDRRNFFRAESYLGEANSLIQNKLQSHLEGETNKSKFTDTSSKMPKNLITNDKTSIKFLSLSKEFQDLRAKYDKALNFMNQRNLNKAIKLFREIYTKNRTYEDASQKLIACLEARVVHYYANRQYEEAMKDILEGLKIDPFNKRLKAFYGNTEEMLKTAQSP